MTHGKIHTYQKGCRCRPCVQANYRAQAKWRAKAADGPIPESAHGTINGYKIYGCRCDRCKAARADEQTRMTARRRRLRALAAAGLPCDWEGDIPA